MVNPPLRLLTSFQNLTNQSAEWLIQTPGRDMWLSACSNDRHDYVISVPDLGGRTQFDYRGAKLQRTLRGRPLPKWAHYIAVATQILGAETGLMPGMFIVIVGDEPTGPRYEYALGMTFAALWYTYHQIPYDAQKLFDALERNQP